MKTKQEDVAFGCVGVLSREEDVYNHGLTKREYFAAMAMQGLLAKSEHLDSWDEYVQYSVTIANALINELNQNKEV